MKQALAAVPRHPQNMASDCFIAPERSGLQLQRFTKTVMALICNKLDNKAQTQPHLFVSIFPST